MINAPAKINLSLPIIGRRQDGYHLMRSIVCFADLCDQIQITPLPAHADQDRLIIEGPMANELAALAPQENIMVKALNAFRHLTGHARFFQINLAKNIPVAAGIGGGSTDAAAILLAAAEQSGHPLSNDVLADLGLTLGADVPVCLKAMTKTCWEMRGIGEELSPLNCPDANQLGLILINPGVRVSTASIFAQLTEDDFANDQPPLTQRLSLAEFIAALTDGNSMTRAAAKEAPIIAHYLNMLAGLNNQHGYLHHGMSGSGATCFALFATPEDSNTAAEALNDVHWKWSGGIYRGNRPN